MAEQVTIYEPRFLSILDEETYPNVLFPLTVQLFLGFEIYLTRRWTLGPQITLKKRQLFFKGVFLKLKELTDAQNAHCLKLLL